MSQHGTLYCPLTSEEIRLVLIEKGGFDDPIRCYLQIVTLDRAPEYVALSYVWGTSVTGTIVLDGVDFNVTTNLGAALRYLRSAEQNQAMWIDAICINQNDYAERAAQVTLMGRIYRNASLVLSWLGESVPSSPKEEMEQCLSALGQCPRGSEGWLPTEFHLGVLLNTTQLFRRILGIGIDAVREYWTRVWIVQEVILASSWALQIGNTIVREADIWKSINGARELAMHLGAASTASHGSTTAKDLIENVAGQVEDRLHQVRGTCDGVSVDGRLLRMLGETNWLDATKPQDKMFGLFGLAEPAMASHPALVVDYDKPIRDLVIGIARASIETSGSLDVLLQSAPAAANPDLKLPTWVPDWTKNSTPRWKPETIPWPPSESSDLPEADLLKPKYSEAPDGQTVLSVPGRAVAVVSGVRPFVSCSRDPPESTYAEVLGLYVDISQLIQPQSRARALFIDTLRSRPPHSSLFSLQDVERLVPSSPIIDIEAEVAKLTEKDKFNMDAFVMGLFDSRFVRITFPPENEGDDPTINVEFLSKMGLAGAAEEGDFICFLLDCSLPVLLRHVEDMGDIYHQYVGSFEPREAFQVDSCGLQLFHLI